MIQNFFYISLTFFIQLLITGNSSKTIVLLGDSLVNRPYIYHDMKNKIMKFLISRFITINDNDISILNYGIDGNKIFEIFRRTENMLVEANPDAVILYWDSDISDIDESILSNDEISALRSFFYQNVTMTCEMILKFKANISLAVAGPSVLGEGGLLPLKYQNKISMLNDYRNINQRVCSELGIPYIDMRSGFLNDIGNSYYYFKYFHTVDGEHPNDRGTLVESSLFASQINFWMMNYSSALYYASNDLQN